MAGNLADCMPTASCRLRPTPTRPSSEAPTSPARCSQARSHCFSLPCSFTCPSFPPRAACHDCWHLTTFISSSLEARSILCPQPVCKNLSRTLLVILPRVAPHSIDQQVIRRITVVERRLVLPAAADSATKMLNHHMAVGGRNAREGVHQSSYHLL